MDLAKLAEGWEGQRRQQNSQNSLKFEKNRKLDYQRLTNWLRDHTAIHLRSFSLPTVLFQLAAIE